MLDEFKIISSLAEYFPDSIGDDAAVISFNSDESLLLSKDLLIEDVHFRLRYSDLASLAIKSIEVNLSDIAAMGGVAKYIMLGISIPRNFAYNINDFTKAFAIHCKLRKIELIGGDTTASANKLFISITIIGQVKTKNVKYRNQAQSEDVLFVAGDLGNSYIGFYALENKIKGFTNFKKVFLQPQARSAEGVWLSKQNKVTSMMDISDGLYIDLKKFCEANKLGADIFIDHFQFPKTYIKSCNKLNLDIIETSLIGGEDYSLLFSTSKEFAEQISMEFHQEFGYKLKKIGVLKPGSAVNFYNQGKDFILNQKHYSHFGEEK